MAKALALLGASSKPAAAAVQPSKPHLWHPDLRHSSRTCPTRRLVQPPQCTAGTLAHAGCGARMKQPQVKRCMAAVTPPRAHHPAVLPRAFRHAFTCPTPYSASWNHGHALNHIDPALVPPWQRVWPHQVLKYRPADMPQAVLHVGAGVDTFAECVAPPCSRAGELCQQV